MEKKNHAVYVEFIDRGLGFLKRITPEVFYENKYNAIQWLFVGLIWLQPIMIIC